MKGLVKILSLGAGVQSSTILRMAIKGEIERPDHVIFADTGWEPRAVYEHLGILELEMAAADIPFHHVSCGRNIKEEGLRATAGDSKRYANLPFYVIDRRNGKRGMLKRQCTSDFKIDPIVKKIYEIAKIPRKSLTNPNPQPLVEQWLGISVDEMRRVKMSRHWWAVNYYPLIELGMTRSDCMDWNMRNGFATPPRSACIGCPFRSNAEWEWMRHAATEDFEEACEFDEAIRVRGGMFGDLFVHRSATPLRTAVGDDDGQGSLFGEDCAGVCGV
jgi:hypothetical protein